MGEEKSALSSRLRVETVPLMLLSLPARSLHCWCFQVQLCKTNIERPLLKCCLSSCFLQGIKRLDLSQKIYRHLFQILNIQLNRHSACWRVGLITHYSGDKILASGVCHKFCIRLSWRGAGSRASMSDITKHISGSKYNVVWSLMRGCILLSGVGRLWKVRIMGLFSNVISFFLS